MSKINQLSSKIYNRIAAGEVVERPFSVVKELVENSIDAGADNIVIEIQNGGISSIKITDNGSGIEKSELKKALLPHATSKISTIKDLDNITSLGFRGEALASIASVSKINIASKPKDQEVGAQISAEGGEMQEVTDCAATDGTIITVNNLFFNTPVREKFLKSERSEESEISSTVAKFILGNPNISFKYVADNKVIYQSFGDGFESAMACIYGADVINECFNIDTEKNGIKIRGYIGKHHFTKGNRTYQTTFINGRYIINQTVSAAIANAYSSYLMKRQYPFYVLSLELPSEIVDVNVHPNKLDVRFANNQIIYSSIYSVVSKVLDGTSEAINIVAKSQNIPNETVNNYTTPKEPVAKKETQKEEYESQKWNQFVFCDVGKKAEKDYTTIEKQIETKKQDGVDIFAENKAFLEKLAKEKEDKIKQEQTTITIEKELKVIGQALNTFLILEDGQDLYFIDQHAAHEKLLFDKINKAYSDGDMIKQPLLIPFVLNVNNEEYQFILSKINVIYDMGIEISEFGRNAFKISTVPAFLSDINLQKFFNDILNDLDVLKSLTLNDVLFEKLAQKACKSAIKAGDKLSQIEIDTLLNELKNNLGLKCPHGRPVAIKITRTEIDKWFKRIV
ncbi:MAG: DNA mismatch repair endonuclease MutL [Clostridiales bacterium]|nr:DNA mismatch repair endonuclease MutL [Clostridiales bacterium]